MPRIKAITNGAHWTLLVGGIVVLLVPIVLAVGFLVQSYESEHKSAMPASAVGPLPNGFERTRSTTFDVHLASMTFKARMFVISAPDELDRPDVLLGEHLEQHGWQAQSSTSLMNDKGCIEIYRTDDPNLIGEIEPTHPPMDWVREQVAANPHDVLAVIPPC